MWQVLEPLRSARPSQGGQGLDIDVTMELRALDLIFPSPTAAPLPN